MAKQVLSVGSIKNDGTGDSLRDGAKKINDNFTELYNALGATTGQLSLVSRLTAGNGVTVSSPSGAVIVTANIASTTQLGSIIVGDNLTIDNDGVLSANAGGYTLPIAERGTLGGIKIGDSLQISETGVVNVIDDLYTLPTATSQVLGGIKVGSRLTITNGVLSADVQALPTATTSVKGGVIVDGITIGINGSGVISVLSAGASLANGDHTFALNSDGTLSLDGSPFTGGGGNASTGDFVFDVNNVYMANLDEAMYLQVEMTAGGKSSLSLEAGDLSNTRLQGVYDVDITSNAAGITNTWTFDRNGNLTLPGPINQTGSYTSTKGYGLTTPSQVVWSGSYDHISSVKLTIQVEADETGDDTGWHSQACEAIIASRGYGNGTYGYGDPIMTVYGVTYTSTVPLVTFSVQRNATTHLIELVATKTAAAGSNAQIKIHSVEMGTSD